MNFTAVIVSYKESTERLCYQLDSFGISSVVIDNSIDNIGYIKGVNKALKEVKTEYAWLQSNLFNSGHICSMVRMYKKR